MIRGHLMKHTFLVTEATDDTGGYAVEYLLACGHEVRALAHPVCWVSLDGGHRNEC
jgi:nucleoside-diphosphate-sugar epimerase